MSKPAQDESPEVETNPEHEDSSSNELTMDLDTIAVMLEEEDEGEGAEEPTDGDKPTGDKPTPENLDSLAEELGVKVEDLYKLKVPKQGVDGHYTLGELKDLAAEQDDFTVRTLEFEDSSRRKEAELVAAEQEIELLIQALPQSSLKGEILDKVTEQRTQTMRQELQKLVGIYPNWTDENQRAEDIKGIVEHLASHGLSERDLVRNFNAKFVKYVRTNQQRDERLQKALAKVKERKAKSKGKGRATDKLASKGTSRRQVTDSDDQRILDAFRTFSTQG